MPDIEYWQRQIKCQWCCPVRTDARGYVIAIAEGRHFDGYKIAHAQFVCFDLWTRVQRAVRSRMPPLQH